jgi:carboxylesterase type B
MSWKIHIFSILLILLFISSIVDSTSDILQLSTSSGTYEGRTVKYENVTVQQYLGIEYARIHNRFDRAVPIRRVNSSIISATSFGPLCKPSEGGCAVSTGVHSLNSSCSTHYGIFNLKSVTAEQCLFLNVFMPINMNKSREKKAIFMWIHGGSGQIGTGNLFDGTVLAALGNIIIVTFNFRLNLFGFLSSGDERLEGNIGLYDQALVLDWIYENADAFGGDIERITVGGHSAGAPHAFYLSVSPLSQGRVRRLILQSGTPLNVWSHIKADEAMEKFNTVANDNECGNLRTFDEKIVCLRKRNFDLMTEKEHHSYMSANHTNVVAHGKFMSQFYEHFDENSSLADVDILMGAVDDEGKTCSTNTATNMLLY